MIHVRILPRADQDIDEAADGYVEQAGVDLGLRFLAAVDRTWTALAEFPLVGRQLDWSPSGLEDLRRWQVVKPFSVYQVFYRFIDGVVEVVRVLHGSRDLSPPLRSSDGGSEQLG